MKENKSVFSKILLVIITLCLLAIVAFMFLQFIFYFAQIEEYEEQLKFYETELENSKNQVAAMEEQLSALEKIFPSSDNGTSAPSPSSTATTDKYTAWLIAQSAEEPYDLYNDLKYAYKQLIELHQNSAFGTVKYKAAVDLLIPEGAKSDVESYFPVLERYFGVDMASAQITLIDDLVSVDLLKDDGNNSYSWYYDTLNAKNAVSSLYVTEDVAEALMGILRAMDWDI